MDTSPEEMRQRYNNMSEDELVDLFMEDKEGNLNAIDSKALQEELSRRGLTVEKMEQLSQEREAKKKEAEKESEVQLDEEKLQLMIQKMKMEQNFPLAMLGGFVAAIVGALIWAGITAATKYQIGWMAVGVGFLVGYTIRFLGKGVDPIFGYCGGFLALLGCFLGNYLTIIILVSIQEDLAFLDLLFSVGFDLIIKIMVETFHIMDLLFYGIAVYEGYRFSFRQMTEEELKSVSTK